MEILFNNQTTNGEGAQSQVTLKATGSFIRRSLHISGNLDGGKFELMLHNGTSFFVVKDSAVTVVPDVVNFEFRSDFVKGKLSGCGASCNITAILI